MAEWKTDTEEVKEVVDKCREFKRSLQEEKCSPFIKNLDSYALKIIVERRKIEMQLEKAIGELKKAKKERKGFWGFLGELGRDFGNAVGWVIHPVKLCAELCEKGLNLMEDNIEKREHNVRLLERMLEIYSTQAKASVELVEGAWKSVKKSLNFYTDKHQEFIRRLKQASDAIDNEYNFPTPGVLMEYDFERPTFSYSPKKSVFDERLKDLREDFSFSLCADLETELERATENLSQKIAPVLERYENDKHHVLGYGEFLEKEKEGFMVDEQNPYPDEVRFNALRLAEFDSVFSAIVPLEDLDKTACAHHALKALEAALKNRDLGFDATEIEQIAKGFILKGYLWHFDANVLGNVALVREELLLGVKHTKRYLLWKQFLQIQN
ncbi:HNH endonuclease [Helicobacter pylori]|nr:HNH endonuclease [Helicobacter pylori]WQZ11220.1 HNH endonuclease [Helicobacter pylori]WQZ16968.1 HNH endonuclease [Helicobacter pylori]